MAYSLAGLCLAITGSLPGDWRTFRRILEMAIKVIGIRPCTEHNAIASQRNVLLSAIFIDCTESPLWNLPVPCYFARPVGLQIIGDPQVLAWCENDEPFRDDTIGPSHGAMRKADAS